MAVRRQQTLRASVDWSHALLTEPERVVFARLAPFMGGFDLDAAGAVTGGGDVERFQVLDLLTLLVDKSLVVAESTSGPTRYRLLETVRQHALEKLGASSEADAVRARHRDYDTAMAALLDTHPPHPRLLQTSGSPPACSSRREQPGTAESSTVGTVHSRVLSEVREAEMRKYSKWIVIFFGLVMVVPLAAPASAHHGWGAYQDTQFEITGPLVTPVSLGGPHGTAQMRVDKQVWDLVFAPSARTERAGLTEDAVPADDVVTASGHRHLDPEKFEIKMERLTWKLAAVKTQDPGCHCGHLAAQLRDGWTAALMDHVRQHDHVGVRPRVHPQRHSGETGVAEAADGKDHAAWSGLVRIDIPAEAA